MKRCRSNPLLSGWVCPNCGQVGGRHGRGGARRCRGHNRGPICDGLVCRCGDGVCYSKSGGRGWRRSPCPNAYCWHCGWKGEVRSRDFERAYGHSRCPGSPTGWHHALARLGMNPEPDALQLDFSCSYCGVVGECVIHPIEDITWKYPESH